MEGIEDDKEVEDQINGNGEKSEIKDGNSEKKQNGTEDEEKNGGLEEGEKNAFEEVKSDKVEGKCEFDLRIASAVLQLDVPGSHL